MCVLFYLCFGCTSAYVNVYFKTTIIKQDIRIILIAGVSSSQALPGYLITAPPSVCVPDVIGVRAVWIQNQKKQKNLDDSDVLIVREIGCGSWLAREYMPAHQHCGLFYPLGCGLEGSPLNKGRPLVLRSGTVFWVLSG